MVSPNTQAASMNPESFSEGGAIHPINKNATITEARFMAHQFTNKEGALVGNRGFFAFFKLKDDEGQDYDEYYSVGNVDRWMSPDGRTAVPVGHTSGFNKGSNFGIFMAELINAGYPQPQLTEDITKLVGLKALWHTVPTKQAEFAGAQAPAQPGQQQRDRVIAVPRTVYMDAQVPGATSVAQAPLPPTIPTMPLPPTPVVPAAPVAAPMAAPVVPTVPQTNGTTDISQLALTTALKVGVAKAGNFTLQDVMASVMGEYASDPNRDSIAGHVFTPEFQAALVGAGYTVTGHQVSK